MFVSLGLNKVRHICVRLDAYKAHACCMMTYIVRVQWVLSHWQYKLYIQWALNHAKGNVLVANCLLHRIIFEMDHVKSFWHFHKSTIVVQGSENLHQWYNFWNNFSNGCKPHEVICLVYPTCEADRAQFINKLYTREWCFLTTLIYFKSSMDGLS
jgi:hypothetical protein